MSIPITPGTGSFSVAAEAVGGLQFQQVQVYGRGGASVAGVNPDGSLNVSIIGTVTTSGGGSVAAWLQSSNASVITVGSPVANQSVSGTVGASIIGAPPANLFVGGALVTTSNPVPIQPPASGVLPVIVPGSVITVGQGSIATVIVGGSIATTTGNSSVQVLNFPTNQSVSGSVGITGNVTVVSSISGGIFPISGSVGAVVTNFPTTQNVSGSVVAFQGGTRSTSIVGQVTVVSSLAGGIFPISGSVAAVVTNFPTTQNVSGSVVAFQGGTRIASVSGQVTVVSSIAGGIFPVSGSVAATITGTPNVNTAGSVVAFQSNPSVFQTLTGLMSTNASVITVGGVSGNSSVMLLNGTNVIGSVMTLQGTNPWIITGSVQGSFSPAANQSVSGTVQTDVRGSVATVIIGGSIATATTNSSVMLLGSTNVIGSVMTLQGTNPWIITGSVQGSFSPAANQSVSGTVGASIIGQPNVRISDGASIATIRALPSNSALNVAIIDASGNQITTFGTSNQSVSGTVDASVIGTVPVTQSGTVISSISGQVTVVSSITGGIFPISGSVAAQITNTTVPISGSVAAFQAGTQITSITGVVSVFGTVNVFPSSMVSGHASVNGAASVQVLAAPGTGLYNYVTDFLISNTGSSTTLVTFTDGDGSIMGKTIAPAGGGSNAISLATPMRTLQTNKVVNIAAATATSVLHGWVGGYRAP